ncbi:MAG TPA: AAA family ATPase [Myxococcales bacterium]|jgi:cell division protease FtsH|nr:AAA family ATPase [Myxococcales bacterium]
MSKSWKTFAIWAVLALIFFGFYGAFSHRKALPAATVEHLRADIAKGYVESVKPEGDHLEVTLEGGSQYDVYVPLDGKMRSDLREQNVKIERPETGSSFLSSMLVSWAPLLLLVVLFIFLMRRMGGGTQSIFALRKSTARLVSKPTGVTFGQVGGNEEARKRLADLVDFLKRPRAWEAAGASLPTGVLLEGPPGCGKTLLARAVAGEAKVPFFEVSASEFVEMFVGVGASRVRDLFEQAAKKAPAIVFIDELDAVGRRRGSGMTMSHQEREQALNQILVSMDGFQKRKNVIVIAATNRADVLDSALLRPGRFDIRLKIEPLNEAGRSEVLAIHLRGKPAAGVDVQEIARKTDGLSGAELALLVNEAALEAVRRSTGDKIAIEARDFDKAIAECKGRGGGLDQLDVALSESALQFVKQQARVLLKVMLDDGSEESGELIWADTQFLKLRTASGATPVLAKKCIVRLEALEGTAGARDDEVAGNPWARAKTDAA